jgi:membrane protein DedA with SNARE-associated domain
MPRDDDDDDFDPKPTAPAKSNATGLTLSIIGLVLGVLALLFSFIPCLGYYALWPGVVAVILSAIGLATSTAAKQVPIIALVVSVLGCGIAYWQGTRIDKVKDDVKEGFQNLKSDAEKAAKQLQEDMMKQMKNKQP